MLVTPGTLRHQLAVDYDLPANVRHFVRRLARQQGLASLDPRRTLDRLYAGTGRLNRALEFVKFLEAQEPVIIEAQSSLFGFRRRIRNARRRLVTLGMAVLAVGASLSRPRLPGRHPAADPQRRCPTRGSISALLALLVVLILSLIRHLRGLGRED